MVDGDVFYTLYLRNSPKFTKLNVFNGFRRCVIGLKIRNTNFEILNKFEMQKLENFPAFIVSLGQAKGRLSSAVLVLRHKFHGFMVGYLAIPKGLNDAAQG